MTDPSTVPDAPSPAPAKPSADAPFWARAVSRLSVERAPEDGINLNVEGRRVTGPIQGFGRMWRKRHRIELRGVDVSPEEIVATWKARFGEFWPRGNRFYGPLTALQPGDVAVLNLAMPGGTKLSTGVLVLYADDEAFTLMTPQGHVFAGWITFSAHVDGGVPVAQAEILMRASDPVYEAGMVVMGHRRENRFWEQTLANLAAHYGVTAVAETEVECVDPHYQWSKSLNVWHNSAIRTGIYQVTTPLARVARGFRRRRASGGGPPANP